MHIESLMDMDGTEAMEERRLLEDLIITVVPIEISHGNLVIQEV